MSIQKSLASLVYAGDTAFVSTSDATPTHIISIPLLDNHVQTIAFSVEAVDAAGHVSVWAGLFRLKMMGGVATDYPGSDVPPSVAYQDSAASTWNVGAALSGGQVVLTVTGAPATSIKWTAQWQLSQQGSR